MLTFEFTNALSFSSARTIKRLPSPRCASAIQIVRELELIVETQPKTETGFARPVPDYFPALHPLQYAVIDCSQPLAAQVHHGELVLWRICSVQVRHRTDSLRRVARSPFTVSRRRSFPVTAVATLICDFALPCRFTLKRLRDQPYANRLCLRSKHARGCQV